MGGLGWLGLLALGFALQWTVNLTFTSNPAFRPTSRRQQNSQLQYILSTAAWLLIMIGALWPLMVVTGGVGVLALVVFGMAVHLYRAREALSLMWLLGVAMEKGVPLNDMARSFASERCDEVGCRANRLAQLIEQGMPLADALQKSRHRLPAQAQLAVNLSGSMPAIGKLLQDTARQKIQVDAEFHSYGYQLFYLTQLVVVGACILAFIAIRIIPVVWQIMGDFDVPLSPSTSLTIDFFQHAADYAWILFSFSLLALLLIGTQVLHYLGWTTWEPLLFRRITRRYHAAVILRTLASQVRSAVPIHTTLVAMGSKYPQPHIRRRLGAAASRVSRGESWQQSLQTENLISLGDAEILAAAERVGNLPWALGEIAEGILRRIRYQIIASTRILIPLTLVAIACVVALIGTAILSSISAIVFELA